MYTIQDSSGKCLTEEREILNRWTEYCSELYNHKTSGDSSILNCLLTDTRDDHPILRKEMEAAVQSLKKGKSAGVYNIPAELVKAGGEPSGPSPWSSHFPRIETCSSTRTCGCEHHHANNHLRFIRICF